MWEWREDTGPGREPRRAAHGGWRLDHYGTWVWDPRADARVVAGAARVERLRPAMAALADPVPAGAPRPRGGLDGWEPTPIFRSVASERDRHLRVVESEARRGRESPPMEIPEPHPGSGPLPVQHPGPLPVQHAGPGSDRRRLAPVETVPPPSFDDEVAAESPQDELRRRAERRRRPHREHPGAGAGAGAGGRHALRAVPVDDRGRHAFR